MFYWESKLWLPMVLGAHNEVENHGEPHEKHSGVDFLLAAILVCVGPHHVGQRKAMMKHAKVSG